MAKDVAARERLQKKLEAALAEKFPNAVSRVSPLGLGPPIGWPVQYRVSDPGISELRDIALQLAQIVATDPGARHVNFDWMDRLSLSTCAACRFRSRTDAPFR